MAPPTMIEDDNEALNLLLSNGKGTCPTSQHFEDLSSHLLLDISSTVSSTSSDKFWNSLIQTVESLGFIVHDGQGQDQFANVDDSNNNTHATCSTIPTEFQNEKGKAHLSATSALLGISSSRAASITLGAVQLHSRDKVRHDENKSASENSLFSLLGTRKLLLLVRDYHYGQQIARIRFVAESLRHEQQQQQQNHVEQEDENEEKLQELCFNFLNQLDARATLRYSNANRTNARGLFQLLLSLACAPAKSLQRSNLHPSFALSTGENISTSDTKTADHQFSRHLMEEHSQHYDDKIRTEALEALFVLLYQRIDGGITRGDYVILLMALDRQNFFASHNNQDISVYSQMKSGSGRNEDGIVPDGKNRRSQLSALILAESLTLWRALGRNLTSAEGGEASSQWTHSHPFLVGDNDTVVLHELTLIGKELLVKKLANQVLSRRHSKISQQLQKNSASDESIEDVEVEIPESVALLTFGLLLKLAQKASFLSKTTTAASSLKKLAVECVTIANDECGTFDYLQRIMSDLLPLSVVNSERSQDFSPLEIEEYDWRAHVLSQSDDEDSNFMENLEEDRFGTMEEESAVSVAYASIGREVLIGTIAAFQHSLLGNITSVKEDNIGMLCNLSAKIYRNDSTLCDTFWNEWDNYCSMRSTAIMEGKNLSDGIALRVEADPLCHLLDAAHMLARNALDSNSKKDKNRTESASILPSLMPLLCLIASLITSKTGNTRDIISTFFIQDMAAVALQGCLQLCSFDNIQMTDEGVTSESYRRLAQAASGTMAALHCISRVCNQDEDCRCIELLHLTPKASNITSSAHPIDAGPEFLYNIATNALRNSNLTQQQTSGLVSSALGIITEVLCYENSEDLLWATQVETCLRQNLSSRANSGFSLFLLKHRPDVAMATMVLLQKMCLNTIKFVTAHEGQENTVLDYLTTVGNGVLMSCELLSSGKSSPIYHKLNSLVLSSFYTLVRSVRVITEWFKPESVKETAASIQLGLLQTVSSSASIKCALGYYTSFPVSTDYIDITHTSMSIILLWGNIAESISTEKYCLGSDLSSLCNDSHKLSLESMKEMMSSIQSDGPIELLLNPEYQTEEIERNGSYGKATILDSFSKWVSWCYTNEKISSKLKMSVTTKALKILSMAMRHSHLSTSNHALTFGSNVPLLETLGLENIHKMGLELHTVTLRMFRDYRRKQSTTKQCVLLLHLLGILSTSVECLPAFAKHVIAGDDENDITKNLISCITDALKVERLVSATDVLIASACADILCTIWHSCRENCVGLTEPRTKKLLHPCDNITLALYLDQKLVTLLSAIVMNHDTIFELGEPNTHIKAAAMNLMSKSFQILGKEAILLIQTNEQETKPRFEIMNLLKHVHDKHYIKQWYETLGSFDGLVIFAKAINSVETLSSALHCQFANGVSNTIHLAIESAHELCPNNNVRLSNYLVAIQFGEQLARFEEEAVSFLSEFGCAASMLAMRDGTSANISSAMTEHVMTSISKSAEKCFTAFSLLSPTSQRFIVSGALSIGFKLTNAASSQFLDPTTFGNASEIKLVDKLEDLFCSSERYHAIVESSFPTETRTKYLAYRLRLNVLLSIHRLLHSATRTTIKPEDQKRFDRSRLRICQFIGDTLNSLSLTSHDSTKTDSFHYDFNFQTSRDGNSNIEECCLDLLRISLSILTGLIPDASETQSSLEYESDLAMTFHNCNMISLLIKHLTIASNASAATYQPIDSGKTQQNDKIALIHNNAVDIMSRIMQFAFSVANSGGNNLPPLLIQSHFVQSITKCSVFSTACQSWMGLSAENGITTTSRLRGYLEVKHAHLHSESTNMQRKSRKVDPVHSLWRLVIRTLTLLCRSCNLSKISFVEDMTNTCTQSIIDFIEAYRNSIVSCLQNFSFRTSQDSSSTSSPPSSPFGFTVSVLNEVGDLLSLFSELCSGKSKKQFETSSPEFYQIAVVAASNIIQGLSTFLGALGTARELFSVLSNLNKLMGEDDGTAYALQESFITHRLMGDGVSNAKHEAIRNALYASSCCICISDDDDLLSRSGMQTHPMSQTEATGSTTNLEQTCQNHLSNDFTLCMELIAGKCVFNALLVIEKVHPSASCFVEFSPEEVIKLDFSSAPPAGTIVAIRSKNDNISCKHIISSRFHNVDLKYARIMSFNSINSTLDIEYMTEDGQDGHSQSKQESGASLSRLAGMEDMSKRKNLIEFYPAPNSVSDTTSDSNITNASVGDLIQILRWCREHGVAKTNQKDIVKGIAECGVMLLGNEIAIHLELGSLTSISAEKLQKLNRQLLELFDVEGQLQNFNLASSSDSRHKSKTYADALKYLVDDDIWGDVLKQIHVLLTAGKEEQEKIRKISDQYGMNFGALGWGRTSQHGQRRSPFKMAFDKR